MPFSRPTLQQLVDRVKADVKGELQITTILRRSFLDVYSRAVAAMSHTLHGFLQFVQRQVFPDTAETEYLDRWADIFDVSRNDAVKAQLTVKATGTPATTIPQGTELQRPDGLTYTFDADTDIQSDQAEITEIQTRADDSDDLGGTYFEFDTPNNSYYVWFNSGSSVNPSIPDRTDVQVDFTIDDDANTIASLLQAELDALTDVTATVTLNVVTVNNDDNGTVDDAVDGVLAPTGFIFTATQQGLTGGEVEGQVTAFQTAEGDDAAGDQGNIETGETLSFVSPLAGIDSTVEVVATITEGEDVEGDDSLRDRLLDRIQQPPSGGNANDYIQAARSVAGVTRAWVFPANRGLGTVDVTFVEDDETNIVPDAAKVQEVQDEVDAFRPVTTDSVVFAPALFEVDLTIQIKPNNTLVRTQVINELQDLFLRDGNPNGAFSGPGETFDGKILLSRINEAISLALDEEDHVLVSPVSDPQGAANELPVLGTITWQTLV